MVDKVFLLNRAIQLYSVDKFDSMTNKNRNFIHSAFNSYKTVKNIYFQVSSIVERDDSNVK